MAAASGGPPMMHGGADRRQRARSRSQPPDQRQSCGIWHITAPSSRNSAICATCLGVVNPGDPRLRRGATKARVHHVACAAHMCGQIDQLAGWDQLSSIQQAKSRASAQTGATVAHMASPDDETMQERADDIAMEDATETDKDQVQFVTAICKQVQNLEWRACIPWSAIHDPIRTIKIDLSQFHNEIAELRGALFEAANSSNSSDTENLAWKSSIFLDRLLFATQQKRRGGKRGQSSETLSKTVARRLRSAWAGNWESLWYESARAIVATGQTERNAMQALYRDIKEIKAALADEDIRSPLRAVDGLPDAVTDYDARCKLPALFPEGKSAARPVSLAEPRAEDIQTFKKELAAAFRYAPKRRSPGPGGGRGEHWSWLPQFPDAWEHAETALLRLALGKVPQQVTDAIHSARVLATQGSSPGKVRPLALGMFLRRSVSKAIAKQFGFKVAAVLSPVEHSLGNRRGAELMHRTVLLDMEVRGSVVKLGLDISNAHNEFDRQAALDEVAANVPEMVPWVWPGLCASPIHIHTGRDGVQLELSKTSGGDQGDAITSLVFPLLYRRVSRAAGDAARTVDVEAREYTYQDDLEIVCTPDAVPRARHAFENECKRLKLRSNPSRDSLALGAGVDPSCLPQDLASLVQPRALVLKHAGPMPLPIAASGHAEEGKLLAENDIEIETLLDKRRRFFTRLRDLRKAGLPVHAAICLVQQRTGGDCTYIARTCGIPSGAAAKLDSIVEDAVHGMLGEGQKPETVSSVVSRQGEAGTSRIFMPGRDAGMGFQSQRLTSAAALAASWHACLPFVLKRLKLPTASALAAHSRWAALALPKATRQLRHALADDTISVGDEGLQATQHTMAIASTVAATSLLTADVSADINASAALRSAGGAGASSWLMIPTRPGHHMIDAQFTIASRVRMHLDQPGCVGTCRHKRPNGSYCGAPLDPKGVHARCCAVGGWRVRRHNAGCAALAQWMEEECGCTVFREQVLPTANEDHAEARMDIIAYSDNIAGPIYIDFTVASALSVEALRKGSALRDGVAADIAAREKFNRYPNCRLFPFPIEDHGRFGEDALSLIRMLAPSDISLRSGAIRRLYQGVASAVQRIAADAVIASCFVPA